MGELHPDALKAKLTARQWAGWRAFAAIEPFGDERDDLRSGLAAVRLLNAWSVRPKAKLEDFLPYQRQPEPTAEDLLRKLQSFSAAHNAKQ